jgi:hypothetical protein
MSDKKVREAARVVRIALSQNGYNLKVKEVQALVERETDADIETLTGMVALSQKVLTDVEADPNLASTKTSTKRDAIAAFCAANRSLVNSDPVVRNVFFQAYGRGNYKKDRQLELRNELQAVLDNE